MENQIDPVKQQTAIERLDPNNLRSILLILLLPLLSLLIWYIHKDYQAFLSLGPGGTPRNPRGYLQICLLKPFVLRNPLQPPRISSTYRERGFLGYLTSSTLPTRRSNQHHTHRPKVTGIAPQRQITQRAPPEIFKTLTSEIHKLVNSNPDKLYTATSCFEKHSTGIFLNSAYRNPNHPTCDGEVCHAHPSDGSMHLTLHPADVKLVIERGWGERHPLAREDWWWWRRRSVPPGFVMVYAPHDAEEVRLVMEIVRAAVWWVSGGELGRELQSNLEGVDTKEGDYVGSDDVEEMALSLERGDTGFVSG